MKIAKVWIAAATLMAGIWMGTSTAWAGAKQQHRWEGVAIGIGAAIAGHALIGQHVHGRHVCSTADVWHRYRKHHPGKHHGRWQCHGCRQHQSYGHQPHVRKHSWRRHGPGPHDHRRGSGHHRGDHHHDRRRVDRRM